MNSLWIWMWTATVTAVGAGLGGCHTTPTATAPSVHYVEIVSNDVASQCAVLERAHGWSFGAPIADLGQARTATTRNGTAIGVRAPLAAHDLPIVRTYFVVDDIEAAVRDAESAGATIAYPPTQQGDTGMWAIYILGDAQVGLWQD